MNVPRWQPAWWRRAQFLWIVPTVIVIYLPMVLYYGVKEIGTPWTGWGDVWRGRP